MNEVYHRNGEQISSMCVYTSGQNMITMITGDQKGYVARWNVSDNNELDDRIVTVKEVNIKVVKIFQCFRFNLCNVFIRPTAAAIVSLS